MSQIGHLSDLIGKIRHDWSGMRGEIQALQPGSTLVLCCPIGMKFDRFRSTVTVAGKRIHAGDWRMGTVRQGKRDLTCYLYPKE